MLARQPQARLWNRTNSNFPKTQGPVARKKSQKATQILRAGNVLPTPRGNPRKWGPGKGDYEHEVLIWSRPRRRFGDFAAVGKVTRRPQAAKPPCKKRNCSIIAPSSGPFGGHLPQRGKAFLGGPHPAPSGPPSPREKAWADGRMGPPLRQKPAFWRGIGKQPLPLFSRFSISSFCARLNVRFCFSATRKAGPSHA